MTLEYVVTMMKKYVNLIKKLGLSAESSRLYVELLSSGRVTMTDLAEKTGIKRTSLYPKVKDLSGRGFVTKQICGSNTFYKATNPDKLVAIAERERAKWQKIGMEISSITPALSNLLSMSDEAKSLEVYEGLESIWNARDIFFEELKKEKVAYLIGDTEKIDSLSKAGYRKKFTDRRRQVKGSILYQILPKSVRNQRLVNSKEHDFARIKFLPMGARSNSLILICGRKLILISLEAPFQAILIADKSLAKLFYSMWNVYWDSLPNES